MGFYLNKIARKEILIKTSKDSTWFLSQLTTKKPLKMSVPSMNCFVATHKEKKNSIHDKNNNCPEQSFKKFAFKNDDSRSWSFSNLFSNFKFSGHDGASFCGPERVDSITNEELAKTRSAAMAADNIVNDTQPRLIVEQNI